MQGDIKEIVGVLMRILGGGDAYPEEIEDLTYEAAGQLGEALAAAHSTLLEFAHDREARLADPALARKMRADLEQALEKITRLAE